MQTAVLQWRNFKTTFKEFEPKLISRLRHGYSWKIFQKDASAGLTVAVVSFPLAMALSVASGTTPDHGLITAVIGGCLISIFGGSRTQIGGPAAAFCIVIYEVIQNHGYDGLLLASFMAGILLVIAGFARLGSIIKYVPYSVITGFTTGLALVILTSQIPDFLGLNIKGISTGFFDKWRLYYTHLFDFHWPTMLMGVFSCFFILATRKRYPKVPSLLIVVVLSSCIVWGFDLNVTTIASQFGTITNHFPAPHLPSWSVDKIIHVFPAALTIAFLAGIESLLCAVIADGMTGDRHRSNIELIAQGIANMVSPLFGGMPATAAFSRTATNVKAGAQTPIAGIIHALLIFIFMTCFISLAGYIPLATLAAILVIVAWDMSALHKFFRLLRVSDNERIVLLLTFVLTVLTDLTVAIQAGIIVSSFFFVHRMSRLTHITPNEEMNNIPVDVPPSICIYHVNGPFFFGAASRIKAVLDQKSRGSQIIYILNLEHMPLIDATGVHVLTHFVEKCRKRQATVILSGVNPQPQHTLRCMGADNLVPAKHQTQTLEEAVSLARSLLDILTPSLSTTSTHSDADKYFLSGAKKAV